MSSQYRYSRSRRRRRKWWRRETFRKWLRRSLLTVSVTLFLAVLGFGAYFIAPKQNIDKYIEQANSLKDKGDLESAVIVLKTALQQDPNSVDTRWLLSEIYLQQRNGAGALEQVIRAQELGLRGHDVTIRLIRSMLLEQRYEEVLARLAFAKATPEDPSVYILRGQARLGLNRPVKAQDAFKEALHIKPKSPEAYIGLAATALALNNFEEAKSLSSIALELDPARSLAWMIKGEILMSDRDASGAEAAFKEAITRDLYNIHANLLLVQSLLVQKKLEQANVHLIKLLGDHPKHPNLQFLIAQRALISGEDLTVAEDALHLSLKEAPQNTSSLLLMGWVKLLKGETETATDYLRTFLSLIPGDPTGTKLLVDIYLRKGQITRAIQTLSQAVAARPNDQELVAMLGGAYLQIGEYDKAKDLLSRAISIAPDAAPIRTNFAVSLIAGGDTNRGISELESVASTIPEYTRAEFLLALAYYKIGDNEKALEKATALAERQPEASLAVVLMGAIHEDAGNLEEAKEYYNQALERSQGNVLAMYNLARLSWDQGNIEIARERYHSILLLQPSHVPSLLSLAQIALNANETDEAISLMEQAKKASPRSLGLHLDLSNIYASNGRLSDAVVAAEDAARLSPNNPTVLLTLGRAQLAAGQTDAALTSLRSLISIVPNSAEAHLEYAQAYLKANDTQGARNSLQKALSIESDNVRIMATLGALTLKEGKFGEAHGIAEEIQRMHPDNTEGFLLEGDIYIAKRQPQKAITAYEEAIDKDRTRRGIMKLQSAYRLQGDTTRGDILLSNWLNEYPEDVPARVTLATDMVHRGNLNHALEEFKVALQYQPDNWVILNNLAWLYSQANDPKGVEFAQQAYELAPDNPEVLDTYGWLLTENNNPHKGLELLKEAAEKAPDNPQIRYHLSAALAQTGQTSRARKELETILKMKQDVIDSRTLKAAMEDLE